MRHGAGAIQSDGTTLGLVNDTFSGNQATAGLETPLLSALADNGGPTQTMIPATGSPALGAAMSCPKTDPRAATRKANGCTAGAVEVP